MVNLTFQCVEWNSSTIQKSKIKYKECCNISSCFQNFHGNKLSRSTVCMCVCVCECGKKCRYGCEHSALENILTEEKLNTRGLETIT